MLCREIRRVAADKAMTTFGQSIDLIGQRHSGPPIVYRVIRGTFIDIRTDEVVVERHHRRARCGHGKSIRHGLIFRSFLMSRSPFPHRAMLI